MFNSFTSFLCSNEAFNVFILLFTAFSQKILWLLLFLELRTAFLDDFVFAIALRMITYSHGHGKPLLRRK